MRQINSQTKVIVSKCIVKSKPVIIATQVMERMITNFRPSRAEMFKIIDYYIRENSGNKKQTRF